MSKIIKSFSCAMAQFPMGTNCQFKKNGSHKWETISELIESVERNVNGLRQTDIRFCLCDPLWDLFEGDK